MRLVLQHERLVTVCAAALTLAGCGGFRPHPLEETTLLDRAETRHQRDVSVTIAVPTTAESRALFDSKLHKKRIQPIWIEVRNEGEEPAWFFPHSVDPDYFPPLEVAWRVRRTWARKTNRAIEEYFYQQAMPEQVPAAGSASGFVFANLDPGARYVPVEILRQGTVSSFEFFPREPGFVADYDAVDFEGLYPPEAITALGDEDDVRRWVASLPCCASNREGTRQGDPLNFVLVGSLDAFVKGFLRSGWDETAPLTTGTAFRTATAAVFGKTYGNAPMSSLYALGRPQDIGLQKARRSVHHRNHLRLWLAPVTFRGALVWVGQISRDIGTRITTKSPTLTTHKIDPDVDDARDMLTLDLASAKVLSAYGWVAGVGAASPDDPRRNLTGDPYFTDGLRVVMFLSETRVSFVDARYLGWDEPPDTP